MASPGFAVTISAVDKASATIESLNKRIAAIRAPAERFNKSLAKFGDVSGVNRLSEGIATLGDRSLSFARSIEKAAGPMAAITSATTIAGVIELSRQWAKAGNAIGNTAYALSMPVSRMSALQGGAKLAGSSVEAMTKSLQGANEVIKDAQFHRADAATPYWQQLGIQPVGPDGKPITPDALLREFADKTKNMTPHARMRAEVAFGIDTNLDPMLRNGARGFDDYVKKAQATGGTMDQSMVDAAKRVNTAWERLGLDFEGIANRIEKSWSGTEEKVLTGVSHWIEKNKGLSDSIAQIGTAIAGLALLKPAAWVLRLLGLGVVADAAVPTAVAGVAGYAIYQNGQNAASAQAAAEAAGYTQVASVDDMGMPTAFKNPKTGDVRSAMSFDSRYSGMGGGSSPAGRAIAAPKMPSAAYGVMQDTRAFWESKGFTPDQVAGILAAGPAAESGFNPNLSGDHGTSYGLYQEHNERMRALMAKYGPHPTAAQQNEFAWNELNEPQNRNLLASLRASRGHEETARVWTNGFERPAGGEAEADRRAAASGQFVSGDNPLAAYMNGVSPNPTPYPPDNGNPLRRYMNGVPDAPKGAVHVTVDLNHAPPGTRATATASGAATASPPRVETSMAYAQ